MENLKFKRCGKPVQKPETRKFLSRCQKLKKLISTKDSVCFRDNNEEWILGEQGTNKCAQSICRGNARWKGT